MEFMPEEAVKAPEEIELNSEEIAAVKAVVAAKVAKSGPRYITLQAFLTVCLVLALVGGTFAWYSKNRQVKDGATMLQSDTLTFAIIGMNTYHANTQYEFDDEGMIKYIKIGANGEILLDENIPYEDLGSSVVKLNPYDSIFYNNDYTKIFLRVRVKGDDIASGAAITVSLTCSESAIKMNGSNTIAQHMSNFLNVRWAQIAEAEAENITPQQAYTAAKNYSGWQGPAGVNDTDINGYRYLDYAGVGRDTSVSTTEKNTTLSFDIPKGYRLAEGTDDEAVFFIELDYNPNLVQAYLNSMSASSGRLFASDLIPVSGDLLEIVIGSKEE